MDGTCAFFERLFCKLFGFNKYAVTIFRKRILKFLDSHVLSTRKSTALKDTVFQKCLSYYCLYLVFTTICNRFNYFSSFYKKHFRANFDLKAAY